MALLMGIALSAWGAPRSPVSGQGEVLGPSGVVLLTGADLKPLQTRFELPELADPYVTELEDSVVISGTGPYYLRFKSVSDISRGGPYEIVWNEDQSFASAWDLKPVLWSSAVRDRARLWDRTVDHEPPLRVWYGGWMRPREGSNSGRWPEDNFSRDVFAFLQKLPGQWLSDARSVFAPEENWPRSRGDFLGHRYGNQIVMVPKAGSEIGDGAHAPALFYEEVTRTRLSGEPWITSLFMDEMETPLKARRAPRELLSPVNPATGRFYPSAIREDGSALIEGPLYFRFSFEGELWEAIGFSAGSFYGRYPACFASRKVSDGLAGKPYLPDLTDDGSDFYDAGAELAGALELASGPGRPAVLVQPSGMARTDEEGKLRILFHAYRRSILPDHNYGEFPLKYRLHEMFRSVFYASLEMRKRPDGRLRFQIVSPNSVTRFDSVRTLREIERNRLYAGAAGAKFQSLLLRSSSALAGHDDSFGVDFSPHGSRFRAVLHRRCSSEPWRVALPLSCP